MRVRVRVRVHVRVRVRVCVRVGVPLACMCVQGAECTFVHAYHVFDWFSISPSIRCEFAFNLLSMDFRAISFKCTLHFNRQQGGKWQS